MLRFVPRHDDELELEVDDPLLVEVQSEDYWYEGYNMRTGARGIFPAYYAIEVSRDPEIYRGKRTGVRTTHQGGDGGVGLTLPPVVARFLPPQ